MSWGGEVGFVNAAPGNLLFPPCGTGSMWRRGADRADSKPLKGHGGGVKFSPPRHAGTLRE